MGSLLTVLLTLISWLTVNRDVRALGRTAEELAASEEHFRLLTENTSDLVRLLDLNDKATYVSPSVERLLGYRAEEYLALPGKALMHPDELATAGAILTDVRESGLTGGNSTYRLRSKSGAYRYFEVRWSVLKDATGKVTRLHTVGRDVTERRMTEELLSAQAEELRSLSLRDELTKLTLAPPHHSPPCSNVPTPPCTNKSAHARPPAASRCCRRPSQASQRR